jgi:hypothetical protein
VIDSVQPTLEDGGMDDIVDFDVDGAIDRYRFVIASLDAATNDLARAEWEAVAQRLRSAWKEWQGEDCLHETAFGEPFD